MYQPNMTTYLNPDIEYLFDHPIYEYDMKNAGFSIINEFHLLSQDIIRDLSKMEKMKQTIEIGKLQRDDKEFSKRLLEKFAYCRKIFLMENDIQDDEIISVKKDAFFITKKCFKTKFGMIQFRIKNEYSSYLRFVENHNIELYYNDETLDIKGIGESGIYKHKLYMIAFINDMMGKLETHDSGVKRYLKSFIRRYKSNLLDEAYYLEFNNKSMEIDPYYNWVHVVTPFVKLITMQ